LSAESIIEAIYWTTIVLPWVACLIFTFRSGFDQPSRYRFSGNPPPRSGNSYNSEDGLELHKEKVTFDENATLSIRLKSAARYSLTEGLAVCLLILIIMNLVWVVIAFAVGILGFGTISIMNFFR